MDETQQRTFLITGGTGFIGRHLSERLMMDGHYVTIVTRNPKKYAEQQSKNQRFVAWDDALAGEMAQTDVVIHLAGENLFARRWNEEVKQGLVSSRIDSTRMLVEAMKNAAKRPELLISASAVGYYGDRGSEKVTEETACGEDFLARLCLDWETEAQKAASLDVRVVNPRIGIVLGEESEVIKNMRLPFSLFVGGAIGSGRQYVPWVHVNDVIRALLFPVDHPQMTGPYNACAPSPETMSELSAAMGRVMNRPSFFKVPGFVLKVALGEVASSVLASLRVYPKRLQEMGFQFEFEDLEEALADIL